MLQINTKHNKLKGEPTHMLIFLKHNLQLIPEYAENKPRNRSENDNNASTSQNNQENVDENIDEPLPSLEEILT